MNNSGRSVGSTTISCSASCRPITDQYYRHSHSADQSEISITLALSWPATSAQLTPVLPRGMTSLRMVSTSLGSQPLISCHNQPSSLS